MKKRILSIFLVLFLGLALVACGPSSADKADVEAAIDLAGSFTGNPATEGITRDQTFVTKLRDYPDVTITWKSSHPAILSTEGKVTRPEAGEDDVLVTITVTAEKGKAKDTKEVKFLVKAHEQAAVLTLTNLYDDKEDLGTSGFSYEHLGELVELKELTVVGIYANKNGFFLTDGERLLFIYNPTLAKTVKLDEVYDVKGTFGHNYGTAQLSDDAELVKVENATPKKAPLIKAIVDEDFVDREVYNASNLYEPKAYELTGKVLIDTSDSSAQYHTFLVNPNYDKAKIVSQVSGGLAVAFHAPTVNIYYQGLVDPIKELVGRTITITYFPAGVRTDRGGLNYGVFLDEDALKVAEATPEERLDIIKTLVKSEFDGKEIMDTTSKLDLFKTIEGYEDLTITWKSNTPDVVTNEGVLSTPAIGDKSVTGKLTATIKYLKFDAVDVVVEFTVLPVMKTSKVLDAKDSKVGDTVRVEGLVNQYEPKNFHIDDGTAGITMRDNSDLLKTMSADKSYIVTGTISEFKNVKQIAITHVKESKPAAVIEHVQVTETTDLSTVVSRLADLTVTVTQAIGSDDYGNSYVNFNIGDKGYSMKLDNRITSVIDADTLALLKSLKPSEEAPVQLKITGTSYIGTSFYVTTSTVFEVVS